MKRILSLLAALTIGLPLVFGADKTVVVTGSTQTSILTNANIVSYIKVINTGATNAVIDFYDSATTNITYVSPEFTYLSQSVGTVTNVWTSFTGLTLTNIYPSLIVSLATNAASTNTLPKVWTVTIPAAGEVAANPRWILTRGLAADNTSTNDSSVSVTYYPGVR